MMFQFLFAACLILSASAAKYCCSPDQWEADLTFIVATGNVNGTGHYTEGYARTSFDASTRMIVSDQSLTVDGNPLKQKVIMDYNAGVMFIVKDSGCETAQLGQWVSNCIPDNATTDNFYYGLPGAQLDSSGFHIDFGTYDVYLSVTRDTCVPIAEIILGVFDGVGVNENLFYSNITPGIKDRSIFTAPGSCTSTPNRPAIPGLGKRSLFH